MLFCCVDRGLHTLRFLQLAFQTLNARSEVANGLLSVNLGEIVAGAQDGKIDCTWRSELPWSWLNANVSLPATRPSAII